LTPNVLCSVGTGDAQLGFARDELAALKARGVVA
jgi:hypothetical protein